MNTIKSERAKAAINELREEYNPSIIMDIIDIVHSAESDATNRALDAFEYVLGSISQYLIMPIDRKEWMNNYKAMLNK